MSVCFLENMKTSILDNRLSIIKIGFYEFSGLFLDLVLLYSGSKLSILDIRCYI